MNEEKIHELQEELKDALHAIDIITIRLINLAVIENKFIMLTEKLVNQELKCAGILFNIEAAETRIEKKIKEISYFFRFRFKWMERLFTVNKYNW